MYTEFKPIEDLILEDHKETRLVYQKYCDAINNDDKMKWYRQLVYLVAQHSIAEELVLYPMVRERIINGSQMADLDIQQTRRIKEAITDLQNYTIDNPQFNIRVKSLWNELEAHMSKEEKEDLKVIPMEIPLNDRINAGKKFENRKMLAPTRPHTTSPDQSPTLETIYGLIVAPIDKFRDLFSSFPEKTELEMIKQQKEMPSLTGTTTTTSTSSTLERNI